MQLLLLFDLILTPRYLRIRVVSGDSIKIAAVLVGLIVLGLLSLYSLCADPPLGLSVIDYD